MFKTAGLIIILAASVAAAYISSRSCRSRLAANEGILDLVRFIKARIMYYNDPLDKIYNDFENSELDSRGFITELRSEGFSEALISSDTIGCFDDTVLAKLGDFTKKLGMTSAEEQVSNCDLCIVFLENEVEKMRAELPKKARMYSSLCVIAGLGAVLLLI